MEIVIVFSGEDIREVFGPFKNDDKAREWAELNFPKNHWVIETVSEVF